MIGSMPPLRCLLVLLALSGLTSCAEYLDADQARLCRTAIPIVDDSGVVTILRYSHPVRPEHWQIDYTGTSPEGAVRRHRLECTFAAANHADGRLDLVALSLDGEPLGEARLYFLKHYWLGSSESFGADPAPVQALTQATQVEPWVAYLVQQSLNSLPLAAIYGLLAAAYSLVYGLIGRINLAFGEFAAIGGYATLFGVTIAAGSGPYLPLVGSAGLAATAAALFGLMIGRLVFAPLAKATGQQVLVATLGLAMFLQEFLRLTQGSRTRWLGPILNAPVAVVQSSTFVATLTPIAVIVVAFAGLITAALLALMRFSRFGLEWRAYADDPGAAALFGVNPRLVLLKTFFLASGLAGLSGYIMMVYYGSLGFGAATGLSMKALIAAILGGIGSVPGALLGGLAIGGLETLWSAVFPTAYRDVMVYGVLAATLLWLPGGFLGYGDGKPRNL
jgi:branched-chain amino acid transport system permease protein